MKKQIKIKFNKIDCKNSAQLIEELMISIGRELAIREHKSQLKTLQLNKTENK